MELGAVLMSDTGANSGLTLPARKIAALNLTKVSAEDGGEKIIKTAGNETSKKILFTPPVTLKVSFVRLDGTTDSRSCQVMPWCHEKEYLEFLQNKEEDNATFTGTTGATLRGEEIAQSFSTVGTKRSRASSDATSEASSAANKVIATAEVSPIQHRSSAHPNDRATIGMNILRALGAHINCSGDSAVLEIEEESVTYED